MRKKARQCSGAAADFKYLCFFWEVDLGDKILEYSSTQKIGRAKL
jgi:hypothetical protein